MAVAQTSVAEQLDDITECPICTEQFDDPRSLPCIHAFCFKCVESYSRSRSPGDEVPCPLCRKPFAIPGGGICELPKNFFIGKLMQIRSSDVEAARASEVCDACRAENSTDPVERIATTFCVECQEKLCDDCAKGHKKYKISRSHKQVPLEDWSRLKREELTYQLAPSTCDKHKDQPLGFFCNDCKMAICVVCYVTSHKEHDCRDINDVNDKFRQQLTTDVGSLLDGIEKLEKILESVGEKKKSFVERVAETEASIELAAEETKTKAERDKHVLLDRLAAGKDEIVKQLDNLSVEITQQLSFMDSLKKYAEELSKKGAVADVARESCALHDRVNDLLKFDIIEQTRDKFHSTEVGFTAAKFEGNLVGEVKVTATEKVVQPCLPTLMHILRGGYSQVVGVTSLFDSVFVVRHKAQQQIEEYDIENFALKRNIPVRGLRKAYGLESCADHKCLYASCYSYKIVYRVDMSAADPRTSYWTVGHYPAGLSVNRESNVLVTCSRGNQIEEYSTIGTLIRQISLHQLATNSPLHCVQLTTDEFVVSLQHRVCIVDANGTLRRSYGSTVAGAADGELNYPVGLARIRNGGVLVADRCNNRVVMMNSSLTAARVLPLQLFGGINNPWALHLDESRNRLYVGEYDGSRVLIFDHVANWCVDDVESKF